MGPALNADSAGRAQRGDLGSPQPLLWKMLAMAWLYHSRLQAPPGPLCPPARGAAPEGLRAEGVCAVLVSQSIALAASAVAAELCNSLSSLAPPTSQVPGEGIGAWGWDGSLVPTWSGCGMSWGGPEFPRCIPSLPCPQCISITPPSPLCHPHPTPLMEGVNWKGKLRQGEEALVERTQASWLSALNGRGVQS